MSSKVQEAYSYRPEKLDEVLATFPPASSKSQDDHEAQKAIFLAEHVQESSLAKTTPQEKKRYEEMAKVAESPEDKTTLIHITDQVFRSLNNEREAGQLLHILDHEGIPRFLGSIETALFKLFTIIGPYVPGLAMPIVREGIQWETGGLILPAEKKPLLAYLKKRREEGLRVNLNFLGEAILGEQEAEKRFNEYVEALSWPEVEVVSIKISTIFSQLSSLSWNHTVSILTDRLEALYNVADKEKCTGTNGHHSLSKFIYLDMEEYSDMRLTAEAFMKTLDRDGLENVRAGIALQAYIPDSLEIQREITHWAKKRVRSGKSPVTIRLVKGANMEMEKVIASTKGWPQAPFKSKAETDANFKRMLREGVKRENIDAVRLGVASHNVFDLSYAILLGKKNNTLDKIQFEMLEGMANPLRRALGEFVPNLLLYAPACKKESFVPAIGYLIRRLDENTGEQNFLRYAFNLKPDGDAWEKLKQGFLESLKKIPALSLSPRRR
ncbi:MAG: proline dehydrogenase family protein, partial [Nitrospinota bacterium]